MELNNDEWNLVLDALNDTQERIMRGELNNESESYVLDIATLKRKVERHLS